MPSQSRLNIYSKQVSIQMLSNVKNHFHEYWTMHQCLFSWRVSIEIRWVAFWSLSKAVTALPIAGSCFISVLLFSEGDFLVLSAHALFCRRKQLALGLVCIPLFSSLDYLVLTMTVFLTQVEVFIFELTLISLSMSRVLYLPVWMD